jgi:hypothetical protein
MVDVLIRSSGRTSERVSVGFQPRCLRVRSLSITVENTHFSRAVQPTAQGIVAGRRGLWRGGRYPHCSQALTWPTANVAPPIGNSGVEKWRDMKQQKRHRLFYCTSSD